MQTTLGSHVIHFHGTMNFSFTTLCCMMCFPLVSSSKFIMCMIIYFSLSFLIDYKFHEVKDQSCSLFCLQCLAHILKWMNEWTNAILVVWSEIITIDIGGTLFYFIPITTLWGGIITLGQVRKPVFVEMRLLAQTASDTTGIQFKSVCSIAQFHWAMCYLPSYSKIYSSRNRDNCDHFTF